MPLEVFTQRNFVADLFRQILNFTGVNSKIAFFATLWAIGSNVHGSSMARWKARGPVVDFVLVLIELFRQVSRLRRYERILVEVFVSGRGWVTLSANFRGIKGRPATTVGVNKL